jgi:hypothetical protein
VEGFGLAALPYDAIRADNGSSRVRPAECRILLLRHRKWLVALTGNRSFAVLFINHKHWSACHGAQRFEQKRSKPPCLITLNAYVVAALSRSIAVFVTAPPGTND